MTVENPTGEPRLVKVAHSPDPDDCFMFWPIREGWVRSPRFVFEFVEVDTAGLNRLATEGGPDVCAISAVHYGRVAASYQPLLTGTSLGDGYGPVLVMPQGDARAPEVLLTPGRSTTAHAVLDILGHARAPAIEEVPIVPMERVFERMRVLAAQGAAVAALLIHEGRLVFERFGCRLVLDLGRAWKERTGGTLPLGINVIHRRLDASTRQELAALLRESCQVALARKAEFVSRGAGGNLDRAGLSHYLDLYANEATLELPESDREAFDALITEVHARGGYGPVTRPVVDWI